MLPPSEARTPRLVTSVMSGAVTWMTSAPARPQTASRATSATTASPSLPGLSTGSARCTSNRSCAIDQTAWWRCTSATAIRAAVRLAAASSTAGAAAARFVAYSATCSCTADRARTSRRTVCASQAASRCAAVGSAVPVCPAMVRRASALVRLVFCPACWCSSHSVRLLGGLPCLSAYSWASRFSSPVTATARELNRSITSWLTPPTSAPFPSARGTMAYPSPVSLVSIPRSAAGATPSRWLCRVRESRVRHFRSAPSARSTRFQIATCTCSCGSPSRDRWCRNKLATRPPPSRHSPVRAEWCPVRV